MFTGLVTDVGEIVSADMSGPALKRIAIRTAYDPAGIDIGASIACQGVCLTVTALAPREDGQPGCVFRVEAASETLAKTLVGQWRVGDGVNLERSLKVGDELGGHLVTGHVDGVAEIVALEPIAADPDEPWGATARFTIRAPAHLAAFVAPKGSICLDGTSLTVNTVDGDLFTVLLIPHSLSVTTWKDRKAGDRLHIEADLMARYAARLAEARAQGY
jgi:riboflavin synthase